MTVSYKRLWKLLIDRNMMKEELVELAGIGHSSLAEMENNGNVNMSALVKICEVLDCTMDDIMELIPEQPAVAVEMSSLPGMIGNHSAPVYKRYAN